MKKFKNTESAQLCSEWVICSVGTYVGKSFNTVSPDKVFHHAICQISKSAGSEPILKQLKATLT